MVRQDFLAAGFIVALLLTAAIIVSPVAISYVPTVARGMVGLPLVY